MNTLKSIFSSLRESQGLLAQESSDSKNAALDDVCAAINSFREKIISANAIDVKKACSGGMKESLVDRLLLNDSRINSIIDGIKTVIALNDPIGKIRSEWTTERGLHIKQVAVPLGVVSIIYESRPNVTADAFALAYKAGCAILLRGSSAALESNKMIVTAIKSGLKKQGIPGAIELAASGSRSEIDEILTARGFIDAVLPRGGGDLIRHVVHNARIPVIETGEGNCHIFVDEGYETEQAIKIIANAKLQRPGVCNAVETLLVHRKALSSIMPALAKCMAGKAELRCDNDSKAAIANINDYSNLALKDAVESDWEKEFLDNILAVKTVENLDEAIKHINKYGTHHSEAILTNNDNAAEEFCLRVDAACVYKNASTRFTDGGEFGFGAELGISTQKFHARGPMGLDALTTIKYFISGSGHIR